MLRSRPAASLALVLSAAVLAACSTKAELGIDITSGQEADAFSQDPAVTRVDIAVKSLDGSIDLTVSAEPGGTFEVGDLKDDQQISLEVSGVDAQGEVVLRGRSLTGLSIGALEGTLPIFVQRTGQWARPPGGLADAHRAPLTGTFGERYLLVAGGEGATDQGDLYDLLSLSAATVTLPRVPASVVSMGDAVLYVDATGATWVEYSSGESWDADLPTGLGSFADVAGGAAIAASTGSMFLVGATRTGSPSASVLEVGSDGTLTAFALTGPRQGAAAAWIEEVGLVVAAGSAEAAGVEVLGSGATAFAARGYPPDATIGAGAVTDGSGGLVLVGGVLAGAPADTRRLDPACKVVASCAIDTVGPAPASLVSVTAYALPGASVMVIGDEAEGGLTRAFSFDLVGGAPLELPLKAPRRGARPVPTPLGTLALVGGELEGGGAATSVETFFTQ